MGMLDEHGLLSYIPMPVSVETIDAPAELLTGEKLLETRARGINTQGEIVGIFTTAKRTYGFRRNSDGTFDLVRHKSAKTTFAEGINDAGYIVGRYGDDTTQAFIALPFAQDTVPDLLDVGPQLPTGTSSDAVGINNHMSMVQMDSTNSVILQNWSLNAPGSNIVINQDSEPWGLDDNNNVVATSGSVTDPPDSHACIYPATSTVPPVQHRFPGETFSRGRGVTNVRNLSFPVVVGQFTRQLLTAGDPVQTLNGFAGVWMGTDSNDTPTKGFGWFPHIPISFQAYYIDESTPPPHSWIPATSTFANGINSKGDIVGEYRDRNGFEHGFLLSSVVPLARLLK